jgi:hypothetical protein
MPTVLEKFERWGYVRLVMPLTDTLVLISEVCNVISLLALFLFLLHSVCMCTQCDQFAHVEVLSEQCFNVVDS